MDVQACDRAIRLLQRVRNAVLAPRAVQLHRAHAAVLRPAPAAVGLVLRKTQAG